MTTSPTLKRIRDSVRELARRGGITEERAFAAWYAICFHDVDEDVALEAASLDGDEDHGVDFLHIDRTNERVPRCTWRLDDSAPGPGTQPLLAPP